jgi:hypothetical protein
VSQCFAPVPWGRGLQVSFSPPFLFLISEPGLSVRMFSALGCETPVLCCLLDDGENQTHIHSSIHSFIRLFSKSSPGTSCVPSTENSGVSNRPIHAALRGLGLTSERGGQMSVPENGFCLHSLSSPPGLIPGPRPGPGMDSSCLSAVSEVSWFCGGPGAEPKGGRDRAVPSIRLSGGAVTRFSKLKISADSFAVWLGF